MENHVLQCNYPVFFFGEAGTFDRASHVNGWQNEYSLSSVWGDSGGPAPFSHVLWGKQMCLALILDPLHTPYSTLFFTACFPGYMLPQPGFP